MTQNLFSPEYRQDIALVMRSAIAGGMDMEQAYQLADVYIQECERSQSVVHVSNLIQNHNR